MNQRFASGSRAPSQNKVLSFLHKISPQEHNTECELAEQDGNKQSERPSARDPLRVERPNGPEALRAEQACNAMQKEIEKKEKWKQYMKQYRLKKKQEYDERLNKVKLRCSNTVKLYDINDINNVLFEYINILCKICDRNASLIDVEALNKDINNNIEDIYKLSVILQAAVKSIIK